MKLTDLNDTYIERLAKEHYQLPAEQQVPDFERMLHALKYWYEQEPNSSPYRKLADLMIRPEARAWATSNLLEGAPIAVTPEDKPIKRKDQYAKLEKLALDNLYHEFTTQQLVDESGLGAQTITNWAKTEGFFRSIGRGKWEARNPKDDRKSI